MSILFINNSESHLLNYIYSFVNSHSVTDLLFHSSILDIQYKKDKLELFNFLALNNSYKKDNIDESVFHNFIFYLLINLLISEKFYASPKKAIFRNLFEKISKVLNNETVSKEVLTSITISILFLKLSMKIPDPYTVQEREYLIQTFINLKEKLINSVKEKHYSSETLNCIYFLINFISFFIPHNKKQELKIDRNQSFMFLGRKREIILNFPACRQYLTCKKKMDKINEDYKYKNANSIDSISLYEKMLSQYREKYEKFEKRKSNKMPYKFNTFILYRIGLSKLRLNFEDDDYLELIYISKKRDELYIKQNSIVEDITLKTQLECPSDLEQNCLCDGILKFIDSHENIVKVHIMNNREMIITKILKVIFNDESIASIIYACLYSQLGKIISLSSTDLCLLLVACFDINYDLFDHSISKQRNFKYTIYSDKNKGEFEICKGKCYCYEYNNYAVRNFDNSSMIQEYLIVFFSFLIILIKSIIENNRICDLPPILFDERYLFNINRVYNKISDRILNGDNQCLNELLNLREEMLSVEYNYSE